MSMELKVKLLSLGAESRVIKAQERRLLKRIQKRRQKKKDFSKLELSVNSIQRHRKVEVRREARSSNLAYGFIRGRGLRQIENKNREDRPKPDWKTVERLILKYSSGDTRNLQQKFEEWKTEGLKV